MTKCVYAFLFFTIIISNCVIAQDEGISLERYRVLMTNGQRVEGQNGLLTEQGIINGNDFTGKLSIPRDEIRVLDKYVGNHGGTGALVGAGTGLATSLLGYMMAKAEADSDPFKEVDDSKFLPLTLGFTAAGALIGWAVGASMKKWERVPLDASLSFDPEFNNGILMISLSF